MDKDKQRWLVATLTELTDKLKDEPGFIEDGDLKAVYMILHSATAAVMFDEAKSLAQVCTDWCADVADRTIENN